MSKALEVVWGLYPGEHDGANGDFGNTCTLHANHVVGIGWPATGDLKTLVEMQADLTFFHEQIKSTYQNNEDIAQLGAKQQNKWFDRSARILRRFLCEAKPGDLVVYACKTESCVYVARIRADFSGLYKYDASEDNDARIHWHYRHFRAVDWVNRIPYSACSPEELRKARTQSVFWRMNPCPERFLAGI